MKNGASRVAVEAGQVVKISKDKGGVVKREVLTKAWSDWVDYWAVDFDFESRREYIRRPVGKPRQAALPGFEQPEQLEIPEYEAVWTGGYIFENEWQSYRTRKNRGL
jgi:hypothetical protein